MPYDKIEVIQLLKGAFMVKLKNQNKTAFTLAEVLITLGIVGIVAAMTLPMLIGSYQKKVTAIRLKKLYSTFQNANQKAVYDFGDSKFWDYPLRSSQSITLDEFFDRYYAPYLKIAEKIPLARVKRYDVYNYNGQNTLFSQSFRASFYKLSEGSCIHLWSNNQYVVLTVDLNCEKKPNIFGKDVFNLFEFYWIGPRKMVVPELRHTKEILKASCQNYSFGNGSPGTCFALFVLDGWEFKSDYPWK